VKPESEDEKKEREKLIKLVTFNTQNQVDLLKPNQVDLLKPNPLKSHQVDLLKPNPLKSHQVDLSKPNPVDLLNFYYFFIKDGCKKKIFGSGLKSEQIIVLYMDEKNSPLRIMFRKLGSEGGDVLFDTNRELEYLFELLQKTPFLTWLQLKEIDSGLNFRFDQRTGKIYMKKDIYEYFVEIFKRIIDDENKNKISLLLFDAFIKIMETNTFKNRYKYYLHENKEKLMKSNMFFIDFMFKLYNTITLFTYKKLGIQLKIRLDQLLPIRQQGELSFILSISNYSNQVNTLVDFILKYTKPESIQTNIKQMPQLPMSQLSEQIVRGGKKNKLSDKTVDQLRTLMKKHKKKCSKDGKRLTKSQLIAILKRC
jgi:hypothetical protein